MEADQREPAPPSAPPEPDRLAEFRGRLAALAPRVSVAPALVAVNVLIAAAMVVTGVHALSPEIDSLIAWGANYGPLTTGGQWWRLATSMFIHIGLIHLLMNMWVLWDAGRLIERLLGPAAFATAYLLAGLAGSMASVMWNRYTVSAGASGAIFGLFGVLGAFLLRHRHSLPPAALSALGRSTLLFVGYNVIFGLTQKRIDMAAHIGGLVGGFVAGLPLVHLLTPEARARANRRASVVLVAGLALVAGALALAPRIPDLRKELGDHVPLVQRDLPGAVVLLPAGKELAKDVAYDRGVVRIDLPWSTGRANLEWYTGNSSADELEKFLIEPLTNGQNLSVVRREQISLGATAGLLWSLRFPDPDRGGVLLSSWPCGQRQFTLLIASGADASQLERRIRDSFKCQPDPALDGKQRVIGVELELGPEFGLHGDYALTAISLDGEEMNVAPLATDVVVDGASAAFFRKYLESVAVSAGIANATFDPLTIGQGPTGQRKVWRGRGKRQDGPARMLVSTLECGPARYIVFYIGPSSKPEGPAVKLLLGARCSANPARPRPFQEIAREACARGDKRGCFE